jgi:hypothetical protein
MRKTEMVHEALGEASLAQTGIVRPKAHSLVIARDRDDAAVAEHFDYAEVIDDAVIVIFAALGRVDVMCIRSRTSSDFFLPVNNGGADAKRVSGSGTMQERSFGKQRDGRGEQNQKGKEKQESHEDHLAGSVPIDGARSVRRPGPRARNISHSLRT